MRSTNYAIQTTITGNLSQGSPICGRNPQHTTKTNIGYEFGHGGTGGLLEEAKKNLPKVSFSYKCSSINKCDRRNMSVGRLVS